MSELYTKVPISKLDVFDIITMKKDAIEYNFFPDVFKKLNTKIKYWRRLFRRQNQNHYFVLFIEGYKGWIIIKEDFYLKEIFIEYAFVLPKYRKQQLFKRCIRSIRKGGYTITLEAASDVMMKVMKKMRFNRIEIATNDFPIYRNYLNVDYKQVLMRQEIQVTSKVIRQWNLEYDIDYTGT